MLYVGTMALYIVSRNAGGTGDKLKSVNPCLDCRASFSGAFAESDMYPGPVVQVSLLTFNDELLLFVSQAFRSKEGNGDRCEYRSRRFLDSAVND